MTADRRPGRVEWPTLGLIMATYTTWALATAFAAEIGPVAAFVLIALSASFHVSLTHEVCHGHPTANRAVNDLLVAPAISLFVPHDRYRALHLAHHHDPILTDPYDDPESNYLDPAVWPRLPRWARAALVLNNTLLGRMAVGPLLSTACFVRNDARLILAGDAEVRRAWGRHLLNLAPVIGWLVLVGEVSAGVCLAAAYVALSLQKVRSYLEHRAHAQPRGRTVIVEDGGPLALLFLNNNYHAVHHAHPQVPWYRLPALYRSRRSSFLRRNFGYRYRGYGEVFRAHLLRPKDPVPHPLMPGAEAAEPGPAPQAAPPAAGVVLPG